MQPQESLDTVSALPSSSLLPHHSSKPSVNGELAGFSQSAFNSNRPPIGGLRDRQAAAMPALNTSRMSQPLQSPNEMQSPGTSYDMNYTPLLPSQLLMGSPFQPGSPSTFASPQFQNFHSFSPQSPGPQQHGHNGHFNGSMHSQDAFYQNMISPTSMASPTYMGGSPPGGYMNNYPQSTSRTVYLGNLPQDTTAEEILGHVRSGPIESVRVLADKNCAFISFLDSSSAVHFHSDAILKKLAIRGQDIKIGWGKPSQVPSSVAIAVQQSSASRNVYLGNLPPEITEEELREELGKFGPIDTVKLIREKAIGFIHFLSIGNAVKAVNQLPQDPKWQPPRRVHYGKDRCSYITKTQQQNAAQYLGIAPGYLNAANRDVVSNALAQQSVQAAAVATAAGGVNNLGNRTIYLGNIHPETTTEEICNVVRGGLLHHIRFLNDKHICFVTFIDPTAAASFYALSNLQGLMIHNRRLKIGWGKHSGALPPAIALAVSGGASRNVYIGNITDFNEERLRQDFSEYGEIELVNSLPEKSCAFVNFTNIANAIKAIEGMRGREQYQSCKINFGKDRCGNPPRQINLQNGAGKESGFAQQNPSMSPTHGSSNHAHNGSVNNVQSPTSSSVLNMYLNHISQQHQQEMDQLPSPTYQQMPQQSHHYSSLSNGNGPGGHSHMRSHTQSNGISESNGPGGQFQPTFSPNGIEGNQQQQHQQQQYFSSHAPSNSFNISTRNAQNDSATTIGGMLAPMSLKGQHNRALSLPAFSQVPYNQSYNSSANHSHHNSGLNGLGSGLGSMSNGMNTNGYGLAIQDGPLPRWAEEEVGS